MSATEGSDAVEAAVGSIIPCPTCNGTMAIIQTMDGELYRCGSCGDELPLIDLSAAAD